MHDQNMQSRAARVLVALRARRRVADPNARRELLVAEALRILRRDDQPAPAWRPRTMREWLT